MNLNKILIILPDAIGDFLQITPFLENLKRAYPNCKIGVVASPRNIELARRNPHIDVTYLLNVRKRSTVLDLLYQVRKQKYDLLIDLWLRRFASTLKIFVGLCGIDHKIAANKISKFRELKYQKYYEAILPNTKGPMRVIYNAVLEYLGAPPVTKEMRLTYPLAASTLEKARQYVTHPCIVLVCEGSRNSNTLPARLCMEIIHGLRQARPDLKIFLSSLPGKDNIASTIAKSVNAANVVALPDIDGSLDFTAAIVSLCNVIISTGTGTLHVADAFDTPTVGIFPKDYPENLAPELLGYYNFLPLTSRRAVIHSTDTEMYFPVNVTEVVNASLELLKPEN